MYFKAILLISVFHLGLTAFISTRVFFTLEQSQYFPLLKGNGERESQNSENITKVSGSLLEKTPVSAIECGYKWLK